MQRPRLQYTCRQIRDRLSGGPIDCRTATNQEMIRYIEDYYKIAPTNLYQMLEDRQINPAQQIIREFPPTKVRYDTTKLTKILINQLDDPTIVSFILEHFQTDMTTISQYIVSDWEYYYLTSQPEYLERARKLLDIFGTKKLSSKIITPGVLAHLDQPAIREMIDQYLDRFRYDRGIVTKRLIIAMDRYFEGRMADGTAPSEEDRKISKDHVEIILNFFHNYDLPQIAQALNRYLENNDLKDVKFILKHFPQIQVSNPG